MSIGSAIVAGVTKGYRENLSPEAKAYRKETKVRQQEGENRLREAQARKETLPQSIENDKIALDNLTMQTRATNASLVKRSTYDAFDRYEADGDPRHINVMLNDVKKNDAGKKMFGHIARIDNLVPGDSQSIAKDLGPVEAKLAQESPEIMHDLVRVTMTNGTTKIARMSELQAMTGYGRYATDRTITRNKEIAQARRYGARGQTTANERTAAKIADQSGAKIDTPEWDEIYLAELGKLTERKTTEYRTKEEREALRKTEEAGFPEGSEGFEERYNEEYDVVTSRKRETVKQKDQAAADEALARIEKTAGSEEAFFKEDFTNARTRRKYERDIEKFEKLSGMELDNAAKKDLQYIKEITTLGDPASKITDKETGLLDSMMLGVRKYLSDDVKGLDTTSAYSTFRNTLRHALYGSVLTPGETSSFNEQFGTLGQQTGPVLIQFRTALEQIRSKLEAIRNTNNSYVMYYRTGADGVQLDKVIDALDGRIDAFSGIINNTEAKPEIDQSRVDAVKAILGGKTQ